MCERLELKCSAREISRHFARLQLSPRDLPGCEEISPATPLLIVSRHSEGMQGSCARWGLVGNFLDHAPRSPLLNLRSEGLASTPFYNKLLQRKRCLIPASAFFGWHVHDGRREKVRVSRCDGDLLMIAGVFDYHPHAGTTCALLSTAAVGLPRQLHSRMPLLLGREESTFWLEEHAEFPETEFAALMQPTIWPELRLEALPEPEPSPQLAFDFALA